MALRDLIRPPPTPAADRPPGITCESYTRGEGKRCIHFQTGGVCLLADVFVCSEWAKVNGPKGRPLPVVSPAPEAAPPAPVARDLFGNPIAAPPEPVKPKAPAQPPSVARPVKSEAPEIDPLRTLSPEDIASFKSLNVEVQLRSPHYGELWLVPAYTGQARREITPEHAATLMRVLAVFPGSEVTSFEKSTNTERPERPIEERS